jgi:hypothetical protein
MIRSKIRSSPLALSKIAIHVLRIYSGHPKDGGMWSVLWLSGFLSAENGKKHNWKSTPH